MPPDRRSGSRGKGIQPRTLEVYDDLGIIGDVHAAGGDYYPALAWDGRREPRSCGRREDEDYEWLMAMAGGWLAISFSL